MLWNIVDGPFHNNNCPEKDGRVLLYKADYFEKMKHLLHDSSKFGKIWTELLKPFMEYEDRINRLTQQTHLPTKNTYKQ